MGSNPDHGAGVRMDGGAVRLPGRELPGVDDHGGEAGQQRRLAPLLLLQ